MAIRTVNNGTLQYLVAEEIAAVHCFTTRLGGVSEGPLSAMNLTLRDGETMENMEKNLHILANFLGFDTKKLVMTRQIHSDIVRTVSSADHAGLCHRAYPECDGLITNDPGVALMVFTADCTPILLHDPVTGAVGAAHAGWRGTAADIAGKIVRAMQAEFGCDPMHIRAAIGPNLGACCFETDRDVPDAMLAAFGEAAREFIRPVGHKFYVNLKAINALALRRAGVENIEISTDCTRCNPHKYWSHRLHGPSRGSQGAIIVCKEASK